jgi:uncharacterized protein YjiS (DUF1127 family)
MSIAHAPHVGACPAFPADVTRPSLLARLVATLAREWRIRRDLRVLQTLDDRALRDIGIGHGGLDHGVRHGRPTRTDGDPTAVFNPPSPPLPFRDEWR